MIFIVGAHATGKTYLADYLLKFNFFKIDLGPVLRLLYDKFGKGYTFQEWIKKGEEISGKNFTDDLIVEEIISTIRNLEIMKRDAMDFVIIGSRSVEGLKYILEKVGKFNNIKPKIIFLDAPFDVMYENYKKREGIEITRDEFERIIEKDRQMGLEDLRDIADFVILNDTTREKLVDQALVLLRDELKYAIPEHRLETKIKMS